MHMNTTFDIYKNTHWLRWPLVLTWSTFLKRYLSLSFDNKPCYLSKFHRSYTQKMLFSCQLDKTLCLFKERQTWCYSEPWRGFCGLLGFLFTAFTMCRGDRAETSSTLHTKGFSYQSVTCPKQRPGPSCVLVYLSLKNLWLRKELI